MNSKRVRLIKSLFLISIIPCLCLQCSHSPSVYETQTQDLKKNLSTALERKARLLAEKKQYENELEREKQTLSELQQEWDSLEKGAHP